MKNPDVFAGLLSILLGSPGYAGFFVCFVLKIDLGLGTDGLCVLYDIGGSGNGAKPIECFFLGTVYPTRQNFSLFWK